MTIKLSFLGVSTIAWHAEALTPAVIAYQDTKNIGVGA